MRVLAATLWVQHKSATLAAHYLTQVFINLNINNFMRKINLLFSLTPSLLFFLGFLWSMYNMNHMQATMCGGSHWEMPVMWLVMCIAHLSAWLMWYQQKRYQKINVFPDKQQ